MKRLALLCLLAIAAAANGQINSFEKLNAELKNPTLTYETIKQGADSLFEAWHTSNPNDSGFAPFEKHFLRWDYFSANRHYMVGQPNQTPTAFKSAQNSTLSAFTPCAGPLPQSGWQNIGPNPKQTDKQAVGLIHAVEGYFSPYTSNNPDDLTLYASSGDVGGLFKSTDGGKNWVNISDQFNIPALGVRTISVDWNNPQNVLAGTSGGEDYSGTYTGYGILKFGANGNMHIEKCYPYAGAPNANEDMGYVEVIKRDYTNSNIVYAAGKKKIWVSGDGGTTWTKTFENPTTANVDFIDIEIHGGGIFVSSVYYGDRTDASFAQLWVKRPGNPWVQAGLPNTSNTCGNTKAFPELIVLDATPADPGYTYAFFVESKCNKTQYLYKTNNGGITWTKVAEKSNSTFLPNQSVGPGIGTFDELRHEFELSDLSPYTMYIGSNELWKVIYSPVTNTWNENRVTQYEPTGPGLNSTHADIRGICNLGLINGLDRLLIANDGGVAVTTTSNPSAFVPQWQNTGWINLNGRGTSVSGLNIGEYYSITTWKSNENKFAGSIHNGISAYSSTGWTFGGTVADRGYSDNDAEDESYYISCLEGHPQLKVVTGYNTPRAVPSTIGTNEPKVLRNKVQISSANSNWLFWGGKNLWKCNTSATGAWQQITPPFPNWNPDNASITAFKTAPSDINTIFVALDQPYWEAYDPNNPSVDKRKKLYKTTDGGQTWQNFTANFVPVDNDGNSMLQWLHITDFTIDPLNPDRVWASCAGYETIAGVNRVFYTNDGGLTWDDLSAGLPPYPINALTYHEGTSDVIYAATDAGVYYFEVDESATPYNGQWHCFNNGLPPIRVTHIRLVPCKNKLYASTWGRGLWEADLPVTQNSHVVTLKQNRTIPAATTLAFAGDLVVPSGITLTINGTVKFAEGKSLIIEPGGKVVLDGGTLTADFACNGGTSWEGIQVRGNANLPQSPLNQGVFIAQNTATISHARTAISNVGWGGNDFLWGTQGGIIDCYHTTFLNNKRDIQLISYHDFIGNYEKDYKAKFVECSFKRDQAYAQQDLTAAVSMWDVVGPAFYGCTFDVSNLNYTGNPEDIKGIYSLQSAFRTDRKGSTNTPTKFTGYYKAVHAENMCKADKFVVMQYTEFIDNLYGAHLLKTANARILFNYFEPSGALTSSADNISYGLYLDESSGYTFMENTFFGPNGTSAGAVAKNNRTSPNRVYRNKFSGLNFGMQALDANRNNDGSTGLEFRCNNFGQNGLAGNIPGERNGLDISVRNTTQPDPTVPVQEYGVKQDQGLFFDPAPAGFINKPENLANNRFTSVLGLNYNFANQLNMYPPNQINYFFDPNGLPGNMTPNPTDDPYVVELDNDLDVVYDLHCLAEVNENGNPTNPVGVLHGLLVQAEAALTGKRNQYAQLLNGGNTPELEADILLAGLPEYQALYVDLITMSPFVDLPQIIDLIHKTDFPEMPLRNIILANPHATRDAEVWDALLNRTPAVSQQTLLDIEAGQQTLTTRDILLGQIGYHATAAQYHAQDLLYHYATDSAYWDTDSLHSLLQNRKALPFVLMRAEYYLNRGNYTALNNLWQTIDATWYSEGDLLALPHWQNYYSTLAMAFANGQRYANLSTATRTTLQNQMAGAPSGVWHAINSVLKPYGQGDNTYVEPVVTTAPDYKRAITPNRPDVSTADFRVYPNPAKDYIEVKWDWFALGLDRSFTIEFITANGTLSNIIEVNDWQNNILVVRTEKLIAGFYTIRFVDGFGNSLKTAKVTIIKN